MSSSISRNEIVWFMDSGGNGVVPLSGDSLVFQPVWIVLIKATK